LRCLGLEAPDSVVRLLSAFIHECKSDFGDVFSDFGDGS
jgi:hypothetical protein